MIKVYTCRSMLATHCMRLHPNLPAARRCMRRYELRMQKLNLNSARQIVTVNLHY